MSPKDKTLADRLRKQAKPQADGCVLWTGALSSDGYGHIWNSDGSQLVHRVAYELTHGPIPLGLTIDHKCRTSACINVDHLEAVTIQENIRRGTAGEYNRRKTHCPQGHPYDEQNTYRPPNKNERCCRTCVRESGRRHDRQPERRERHRILQRIRRAEVGRAS